MRTTDLLSRDSKLFRRLSFAQATGAEWLRADYGGKPIRFKQAVAGAGAEHNGSPVLHLF